MRRVIPRSRPQARRKDVLQVIEAHRGKFTTIKGVRYQIEPADRVFAVMSRGYYRDTMGRPLVNDIGIYDDAAFLVGPRLFRSFNFNVDPSRLVPGRATVIAGVHRFKPGLHGISRGNPYAAFIPAAPGKRIVVRRHGQSGLKYGIACNQHRGSTVHTSSHGCLTVPPSQWGEYQRTLQSLLEQYNQSTFPTILVDGWEH